MESPLRYQLSREIIKSWIETETAAHDPAHPSIMPAFVVVPANPDDLEAVTRVQFDAWANDAGFKLIFPKGPTPDTIQHTVNQLENDMDNDLTRHLMLVKDAFTGEIAAYAIWHFYPQRGHDEIEREMLTDHFPLPRDTDLEIGNRLTHNGVRKHHEVVAKHLGHGAPHACSSKFIPAIHLI